MAGLLKVNNPTAMAAIRLQSDGQRASMMCKAVRGYHQDSAHQPGVMVRYRKSRHVLKS